jgi:hypothetical protein
MGPNEDNYEEADTTYLDIDMAMDPENNDEEFQEMSMEPESAEQQCQRLLLLCQTGDWGPVGEMLEVQ